MTTHINNIRGTRLIDVPHMPAEQAIKLLMQKSVWGKGGRREALLSPDITS